MVAEEARWPQTLATHRDDGPHSASSYYAV